MLGVGPSRAAVLAILALLVLAALALLVGTAVTRLTQLCTGDVSNLYVFQTCFSTSAHQVVVGIGLVLAGTGLVVMIRRLVMRRRSSPDQMVHRE